MPIHLVISHEERLVVATVDDVGPEDLDRYFADLTAAGAMAYRKLIDLTASRITREGVDIRAMAERVNAYAQSGALGAIAVVVGDDVGELASGLYERRIKADRPFRLFREPVEARQWLDAVDPPAGG
ncbi:MAG: hypothetical protein AB7O88_22420 [Reyranellaceae bacterium]